MERPILFSAPMVRALLAGAKTQTRRIVKGLPNGLDAIEPHETFNCEWSPWKNGERLHSLTCPYGVPGDVLWVREQFSGPYALTGVKPSEWREAFFGPGIDPLWYWADGDPEDGDWTRPKPSIHMPRWASRISLRITDVRVERLNEISLRDVWAEGCEVRQFWLFGADEEGRRKIGASVYRSLWERINGKKAPWASNPWVWAVSFERLP